MPLQWNSHRNETFAQDEGEKTFQSQNVCDVKQNCDEVRKWGQKASSLIFKKVESFKVLTALQKGSNKIHIQECLQLVKLKIEPATHSACDNLNS